jgi:hypothetical protein
MIYHRKNKKAQQYNLVWLVRMNKTHQLAAWMHACMCLVFLIECNKISLTLLFFSLFFFINLIPKLVLENYKSPFALFSCFEIIIN